MNYIVRKILKNIIPKKLVMLVSKNFQYNSFRGNFRNFNEINKKLTNYDSSKNILRATNALKIASKSNYLIDRDGEVLQSKNQNFQLLKIMSKLLNKSKFNCVVDYGGSLANFYRNNYNYLRKYNLIWIVIDNKKICSVGKKLVKRKNIYFFENLNQVNKFIISRNLKIVFFLFGSSIQYIQKFEKILKQIKSLKINHIIIDRQPVLRSKKTKYVVQKTPFWNGNFSYAVKLYNSQSLINIFNKNDYFLKKKFYAFGDQFKDGEYKSYIFEKK